MFLPFFIAVMPSWYTNASDRLQNLILQIANENNIQFSFVRDSKQIENGKDGILQGLVFIAENANPQMPTETFQEMKNMEKELNKKDKRSKKSK